MVSIPYMRVTNSSSCVGLFSHISCFNPLYAGHKRLILIVLSAPLNCFNPLYAGHKPYGANRYAGPGVVSIPYMRVTNERATCAYSHCKHVSIPYMRVTNSRWLCLLYWCGSFNPLYAGHKPFNTFLVSGWTKVSIPYMRVTNPSFFRVVSLFCSLFQSPICGSQTQANLLFVSWGFLSFNPLYAGHKQHFWRWVRAFGWGFNPLYAGHKHYSL